MRFSGEPETLPGIYTSAEAASLVAVIVFAIVSILAVGAFLTFVARISLHAFLAKRREPDEPAQRSFFQTQLGAYTVSLLLSNFLMSIAFIINSHWVALGRVELDALCTAQGFMKQFSMTASAYFTSAIAIHAFTTLACKRKSPDWLCGTAVVSGWAVAAVMGIVPAMINDDKFDSLYGFDGLSCGISLADPALQLFFQVIPVFLAVFASALFYGLVYLVLRGTISMSNGIRVNLSSEDRKRSLDMEGTDPKYQQFILTVARSLLLYPIAFILLNLTDMIMDLMEVSGHQSLPFGLHVLGDSAVATLGIANACILFNTLRIVSRVCKEHTRCRMPQATTDSESFFAPSSSPIDAPSKSAFSDRKASLSFDSTYKAHASEDGFLTALPAAHFSNGHRRSQVDLSDAMAALIPPVVPKRNSRPQSPDKPPSRYSFSRLHSKGSVSASPRLPAPTSLAPPSGDSAATARHKPHPLKEPPRSPPVLSTITMPVVSPHAAETTQRSSTPRIVHQDAERMVITSPPHSAAVESFSRPASLVRVGPSTQPGPAPQSSPALSSAALSTPGTPVMARSVASSSLVPRLAVPGPGASKLRTSVASHDSAPSSRAPSVASSTTSFRGLPPNPRVLRNAWEDVAAQSTVKMPSPLSSVSIHNDSSSRPAVRGQSSSMANTPVLGAATPSQSTTSLVLSAPPVGGGMPGKPLPGRPMPRSRSNNDMHAVRSVGARPAIPRAASTSARPPADTVSMRTPSIATLRSPSAVSLAGDGAVPLLVGRRRTTMRSSKSVVVSSGGYI